MRGTALFAAVMMLGITIALAVGFGIRLNLFGGGEGEVHKTSLQSSFYAAGNAIDAAELYMKTSLSYSLYQACYDNLARGGLAEITGDKGKSGYAYLPDLSQEQFLSELNSTLITYLNRYADGNYAFLSDFSVTIPKYSSVKIESGSDTSRLTVSAVPSDKMTSYARPESGEDIIIRANADLYSQYDIPCLPIFLKSKELKQEINNRFQAAFSDAKSFISGLVASTSCSDTESCSNGLTGELKNKLGEELRFSYEKDDYLVSSEALGSSVTIEVLEGGEIAQYKIMATQKVTINETELFAKYYPVWNGSEISFEPLSLVFINSASETTTL
jgi:hypothetical protein